MIKVEQGWFEYSLWKFPKGSNDVPILMYLSSVGCTLYIVQHWCQLKEFEPSYKWKLLLLGPVGASSGRSQDTSLSSGRVEGDGEHNWLDTEIWRWVKDEHKNIEEVINDVRLGGKLRTSLSAQDLRVWLDIYISPCCVFPKRKNYHSSEKDDLCLRVPSRPPSRPHNGLMRHILHHNGDASCSMHLHNLLLWNWHNI